MLSSMACELDETNLIEGFHVTSFQANFASHHTRDRHVGFLSPQYGIQQHNKLMSKSFSFSSYQKTKLQV